ncbi:amidase [Paraburkholderia caledonica]|uniref:Aspartyl-tRNA(Asn)/glutamyl-tRNA(Gln) amidotransferase subunit A n=1 Tax=Paraburkholderia caledonica TaxID=134536 RepID=A0AB73ISM9_9BURK|nr:aspartyl-tRNA(Asn)/glutamyl-tRNA(Gln) amidotransferase subunit A [Paraburkholderia caledonica]
MDVAFLSATDLGRALARGEFTSEALVSGLLARIRTYDPVLNAFVEVYGNTALLAARESDERRSRNRARGPLDGVPFAAKDLFDVEGYATLAGSKASPVTAAAHSSTAVRRLLAEGMVLVGKTHTVEFAYGGWGTNPSCGTPVNPRDSLVQRVPGGSSSGSGVAVAAGLVPVALGTDTGGSVRNPSALCGIVGMKTSLGLIGRGGVQPLALVFDTVGPMTRSVEDAALIQAALQGEDPDDPATFSVPRADPRADLDKGIAGLTLRHPSMENLNAAEPGVLERFRETLADLAAMGAILEETRLPRPLETYASLGANFTTAEAWSRYRHLVEKENSLVDPGIAMRMSRGETMTIADYLGYVEQRRLMQTEFHRYLAGADAVLLPSSPITAKPIDGAHDAAAPFGIFARLANLMDLASLSIPMGDAEGLPTAVQIMVRRYADPLAYRIGRALEVKRGGLFVPPSGYGLTSPFLELSRTVDRAV